MSNPPARILFVITNTDQIGPHQRATGYEFSEVAQPYMAFRAEGHEVEFASLKGGQPPEDGYDPNDSASRIFRASSGFKRVQQSLRLADLKLDAYDAILFPGGLGPMVDMAHTRLVKQVIAMVFESGRPVGAVCHGSAALLNVDLSDGSQLLKGRKVTCFTEAEEQGHSLEDVPFMLDAELVAQGALHSCAAPYAPHVVVDGLLVTGQNPASSAGVALAMSQLLGNLGP